MATSVFEEGQKPATAARIYDYILGGTHNFPADREAAKMLLAAAPQAQGIAKANRAYLRRAVRYLIDQGVHQFLDIGSGIPTVGSVHETARDVPDARVVYVDIDPIAVMESIDILGNHPGATAIRGDLRDVEPILNHPEVNRLIDFTKPVGILVVSMLHFVSDDAVVYAAVDRLIGALPSGGYLVISHGVDGGSIDVDAAKQVYRRNTATPLAQRTAAEVERFFNGLEIVEPGLVWVPLWRPDGEDPLDFAEDPTLCGMMAAVGRRP